MADSPFGKRVNTLFDCLAVPIQGMNSTMDPASLPPALFQLLQNVRIDKGSVIVRDGQADLSATGLPSGYVCGWNVVIVDGTYYVYVAVDTGATIQIYRASAVAFSEVTASSGTYGNTRFTTGSTVAATTSSVNNSTYVMTFGSDPGWVSGQQATVAAGGLDGVTSYYLCRTGTTTYTVHTTYANAILGTSKVTLTSSNGAVTPNEGYKRVAISCVKAPTRPDAGILSSEADKDIVVVSDGVKVAVGNSTLVPHKECWLPDSATLVSHTNTFTFSCAGLFSAYTPVTDTHTTVSTGTVPGTSQTADYVRFPTTTTAGEIAGFYFSSFVGADSFSSFNGPQLVIFYYTTYANIWDNFKVQLYDATAAAYVTVYDGTSTSQNKPIVYDCGNSVTMAVIDIDRSLFQTGSLKQKVVFKWVTGTPSANIDIYVYAVCSGGSVNGGTELGMTYYHSGGFCESEGINLVNKGGADLKTLGLLDPTANVKIPVLETVKYICNVKFQLPTNGAEGVKHDIGTGLDYVLFYASYFDRVTGQYTRYNLVTSLQIGAYSGSWGYSVGSSLATYSYAVGISKTYARVMPPAFHRPCLPHTCSVYSGGRLFIGQTKGAEGATRSGGVMSSAQNGPFDFSEFVRYNNDGSIDLRSPKKYDLGSDRVQNIVAAYGYRADNMTSPIVAVTDRNTWTINPDDLYRPLSYGVVCDYGTTSPESVVSGGGSVWFFSTYRQLVKLSQNIERPSIWRVDAQWTGMPTATDRSGSNQQSRPRQNRVSCAYWFDKLYLFYTPNGYTTNLGCSVYDTVRDRWYDDSIGQAIEGAFVWPVVGDKPQLRGFSLGDDTPTISSAPKYYQMEQSGATDDAGTGIVIALTTPYLHTPDWQNTFYGQLGIVADKSTGQTLTVTRTGMTVGTTTRGTGTINLSTGVTGTQAVRWDTLTSNDANTGLSDVAVKYSVTGTYAAGKRIYSMVYKTDARSDRRDVNN